MPTRASHSSCWATAWGRLPRSYYLLDHSELLDGVALSGTTALDLLGAAAMAGRWKLEDLNASFEPARTPFDWLSRDKAVVDAYIADPLCGFNVNAESYGSLFAVAPRLATVQEIGRIRHDLPMFLFVGDLDPVNAKLTWFQPLIDRYRESGLTDVSWHVYGNARHEVLNEINRQEVVANPSGMDRPCDPAPSRRSDVCGLRSRRRGPLVDRIYSAVAVPCGNFAGWQKS